MQQLLDPVLVCPANRGLNSSLLKVVPEHASMSQKAISCSSSRRRAARNGLPSSTRYGKGDKLFAAYLTVTLIGALFNGAAAVTYLIGHEYPKTQADMKGIPRKWVPVLGMLLAAGTAGLLAGLAVPVLGTLAACGLVLYFVGAVIAHLRVGSRNIVGGIVFLATAVAALVLGLAHHGLW